MSKVGKTSQRDSFSEKLKSRWVVEENVMNGCELCAILGFSGRSLGACVASRPVPIGLACSGGRECRRFSRPLISAKHANRKRVTMLLQENP